MSDSIIDVHSHYLPKVYRDALQRADAMTVDGFPNPDEWTVQQHLAVMEENHIASCILSISSPGLRFWSGEEAISLSKAVNEAGAAMKCHRCNGLAVHDNAIQERTQGRRHHNVRFTFATESDRI